MKRGWNNTYDYERRLNSGIQGYEYRYRIYNRNAIADGYRLHYSNSYSKAVWFIHQIKTKEMTKEETIQKMNEGTSLMTKGQMIDELYVVIERMKNRAEADYDALNLLDVVRIECLLENYEILAKTE